MSFFTKLAWTAPSAPRRGLRRFARRLLATFAGLSTFGMEKMRKKMRKSIKSKNSKNIAKNRWSKNFSKKISKIRKFFTLE